jgi:hypothetical protein
MTGRATNERHGDAVIELVKVGVTPSVVIHLVDEYDDIGIAGHQPLFLGAAAWVAAWETAGRKHPPGDGRDSESLLQLLLVLLLKMQKRTNLGKYMLHAPRHANILRRLSPRRLGRRARASRALPVAGRPS